MSTSLKRYLILCRAIFGIFITALRCYGNLFIACTVVGQLFRFRDKVHHHTRFPKYYHANGKYFVSINVPGFPSGAFNNYLKNEFNFFRPFGGRSRQLQLAVFSITSGCPLNCHHCFEWERIGGKEFLSLDQLKRIQQKIEAYGVSLIQYTGGEPMIRIDDLVELLKVKSVTTDCWIFSSGYNLTLANAQKLKLAGLSGVVLSLDHWDAKKHNDFRRSGHAFDWVVSAAGNCVTANLALSLSLCPTRDFVSRENLFNYLSLAYKLKAGFIQILEPRKTGRYKTEDISLNPDQIGILDNFMMEVNNDPIYRKMPTIIFPGYHQRKLGCAGAGHRFVYIDSMGSIHACPFCQDAAGNCLNEPFPELIDQLKRKGCQEFPNVLVT